MKNIQKLVDFTTKHPTIGYNADLKKIFKRVGTAALKELLSNLGPVVESNISFNPAGIAVSGDFHLKVMFSSTQGIDLFFNTSHITYRTISSLKDYTGGVNHQMNFSTLLDVVKVSDTLRSLALKSTNAA